VDVLFAGTAFLLFSLGGGLPVFLEEKVIRDVDVRVRLFL